MFYFSLFVDNQIFKDVTWSVFPIFEIPKTFELSPKFLFQGFSTLLSRYSPNRIKFSKEVLHNVSTTPCHRLSLTVLLFIC